MKTSRRNLLLVVVALAVLASAALGYWIRSARGPAPAPEPEQFVLLDAVKVGGESLQFYVDYGHDSAVLGFSVRGSAGQPRHCPMYGSTYRGLPAVTLEIFSSEARDRVWIRSSWEGYEGLAHYRIGGDRCTTRFGDRALIDRPTPESMSGGGPALPAMDRARVNKIATITHGRTR